MPTCDSYRVMPPQALFAVVAVGRPLPEPLTYRIPETLLGQVRVGHVVGVPLGRSLETGFVVGLTNTVDFDPAKVKPLARLLDPLPAFDEPQLAFFRWIADYYLSPLGVVIRAAVPNEFRAKSVRGLVATEAGTEAMARGAVEGAALVVLRECILRPGLTQRTLARRVGTDLADGEAERATQHLVRQSLAQWEDREVAGVRARVDVVRWVGPEERAVEVAGRSAKTLAVADQIAGATELDVAKVIATHGASARAALARLQAAGVITRGSREQRDLLDEVEPQGPAQPPALNARQAEALQALTGPDAAGPWLLYGVTGSGKTEVFLGAAHAALASGRQVCVLVPEIGLTPQLVGRFRARFGDRVAVLHSGLTGSDRLTHWRRIRAGEAPVVVGARSALFAPFRDLGLVVVDEEHDDSYKQDDGVRYHARDLAVVLGRRHGAAVVLASATPSLESWHNARQGRYRELRLPERATPRPVPRIERVGLREVPKGPDGRRPLLAPVVVDALRATFEAGGQAIVLYNRRGYATLVSCNACGAAYECPSCGVAMTLHRGAGRVICHYCAFQRAYSTICPVCAAPEMSEQGRGTERVEDVLTGMFPNVPTVRMDADTTAQRGAHHRILETFRSGRARMLVGTQIVAKGHDFPDVHTVVIVSADQGLRMPDFRAAERTFALVVQAAGRAGRGTVPGRVLIQSMEPDHEVLTHLDNPDGFYEIELRRRATFRHPPHTRMVAFHLEGTDRARVSSAAVGLAHGLRLLARQHAAVQVLDAAASPMRRLVGRWRWQVLARGSHTRAFRDFLEASKGLWADGVGPGVRVTPDVDPRHLM